MKKPKSICLLCYVRTPPHVKYGIRMLIGTEFACVVNDENRPSVKDLKKLVEYYLHFGGRLFILGVDITKRVKNDHARISLRHDVLHPQMSPRLDYIIKRRGEQWIWKAYIYMGGDTGSLQIPESFTIYEGRLQHEVNHPTRVGGTPVPEWVTG